MIMRTLNALHCWSENNPCMHCTIAQNTRNTFVFTPTLLLSWGSHMSPTDPLIHCLQRRHCVSIKEFLGRAYTVVTMQSRFQFVYFLRAIAQAFTRETATTHASCVLAHVLCQPMPASDVTVYSLISLGKSRTHTLHAQRRLRTREL